MASVSKQRPTRRRTVAAVSVVAGLGLTLCAQAVAANKQDDIQALMAAFGMEQTADQVLAMVVQGIGGELEDRHPDISEDVIETSEKAVFRSLRGRASELIDRIGGIYGERFTEAEIEKLVAFYRTPTGQKYLEARQEITGRARTEWREWSESMAPEIRQRLRTQLRKRGHKLATEE